VRELDRHTNVFGEVSVRGAAGRHTWVGGAAYERESLNPRNVSRFEYFHRVPGFFVQDDMQLAEWLSVSASGRIDVHSTYGNFFSPRVAALLRWNGWTSRIAGGAGFFAPTPLTEETEAAGLTRLEQPAPLRAERGESYSVDLTRTIGTVTLSGTFFRSLVDDPVQVERDDTYLIRNAEGASTNTGAELLATYRRPPIAVTGNYTFVRSREDRGGTRVETAYTPAHSLALVGMWEKEDVGRVGLEFYFTGEQRVENNPFRDRSRRYAVVGMLAERMFGRYRVFVNAENVTGVRQTDFDPLLRQTPAADGRWSVDAWAPLDGRSINAGLRFTF
jgi:outer membrane receptor for ferrienterochelin and colicins